MVMVGGEAQQQKEKAEEAAAGGAGDKDAYDYVVLGGGVAGAAAMVINVSTLMCVELRGGPPVPRPAGGPRLLPPRAGLKARARASLPAPGRPGALRTSRPTGAPRRGPGPSEPAGSGFRN